MGLLHLGDQLEPPSFPVVPMEQVAAPWAATLHNLMELQDDTMTEILDGSFWYKICRQYESQSS